MTSANGQVDRRVRAVAPGEGVCILLVDREGAWRAELSAYLEEQGFEVLRASHAEEAFEILQAEGVDLVVLQAPGVGAGGLNLCRRLSAEDGAPVILVSDRAQEIDRIVGLEVGADDFVSQTCSHRELLARIRAVLRRRSRGARAAPAGTARNPEAASICFAGWTLSPGTLEVWSPAGVRARLTASDFKLLSMLLERPGEPVARERLAGLLGSLGGNLRCLDTGISRLRRKLGRGATGEPVIRTVQGVGYMLDGAVETGAPSAPPAELQPGRMTAR